MSDDSIIAHASRVHAAHPELRPLDWRILGCIIDAGPSGLPLAYVRTQAEFLGSIPAFLPATERLIQAGMIERREVPYAATQYSGRKGRKPRLEVVYCRIPPRPTPAVQPSNFSL